MIKTSKKAAQKLGADLATELHAQTTIAARGGVLAARFVILSQLDYEAQTEFYAGFDAQLDLLEPLAAPRVSYGFRI
jgi:hypothetical protein